MSDEDRDLEVPARAKRRTYSARYKLQILAEYEQLDREGKGALLRRENLYTSLISEWRKQCDRGALEALSAPRGRLSANPHARPATPPSPRDELYQRPTGTCEVPQMRRAGICR